MTLRQAEKAVAELEKEKARCLGQVEALQKERETAAVDRLGPIASELAELRETVRVLEERLQVAHLDLADAKQKANDRTIAKLRKDEVRLNADVVQAREALGEALERLSGVHVQLGDLGALPSLGDTCLFQAVYQSRKADEFRQGFQNA